MLRLFSKTQSTIWISYPYDFLGSSAISAFQKHRQAVQRWSSVPTTSEYEYEYSRLTRGTRREDAYPMAISLGAAPR